MCKQNKLNVENMNLYDIPVMALGNVTLAILFHIQFPVM
jgi:hypothetical protein